MYLHQSSDLILKKLHVQRSFTYPATAKKSYSQHFTSTLNFYLKNLHFARGYIYKFSTANSRRKNNTERRESPFLIYYATSHSSQFARRWQGLNYYSPQNPHPRLSQFLSKKDQKPPTLILPNQNPLVSGPHIYTYTSPSERSSYRTELSRPIQHRHLSLSLFVLINICPNSSPGGRRHRELRPATALSHFLIVPRAHDKSGAQHARALYPPPHPVLQIYEADKKRPRRVAREFRRDAAYCFSLLLLLCTVCICTRGAELRERGRGLNVYEGTRERATREYCDF